MARQFSLVAQAKPVSALAPATDAAGRTGGYISLKNAHKAYVVLHITQGNAATIALSLSQAKTVAGGSAKSVTATFPIWSALDVATDDTLVARTAAASYTTDAGVKNKIVIFEILPEAVLDIANGFDCIAVTTGASNAANITSAQVFIVPGRYQQATPPSAIAD
ncbi:hypothetical protein V5F79_01055 [Xanthobacter flavus]|uniref:hypothetical protein n=1 Tax=Xanthobacter flavus TaxID=281 RepID=UPI003729A121